MEPAPTVLLCGPDRSAVSGVATHLNQLFDSSLADAYRMHQFQVGSEGRQESRFRKAVRYATSPIAFLSMLMRLKPEIVHLNTSFEFNAYWRDLAYLLTARALGRRIVYQVHGGELPARFLGESSFGRGFLRFTLRAADVIVVLAEIELDAYRRFHAGRKLEMIPNAIDLDEYGDVSPKQFARDELVLGYIGRLADDKGIRESILAVSALRKQDAPRTTLRIAGSGPYEAELRRLVKAESLSDQVQFLGPVFGDEKRRFWKDIDVFLFPTFHREGLPYTILEALASGTPTITTRVGGIPDVIKDGIHGLVLDEHTPAAVAEAVRALTDDRELPRRMSSAALSRAREHYGVQRLADQFDRVYRELLS
jgi:glycosyltransferase involved in cell wall biosynthesis